jgi:hypothetical protein
MTVQDLYSSTITQLPLSEQLRLATLILQGLAETAEVLDYRDDWSEQDIQDVAAFSSQHAIECFQDESIE